MPTDFDKQSYWDDRFTTETSFEWLIPSPLFMSLLEPYLNPTTCTKILHIGFGTSDLQTHLRRARDRGLIKILNIDFSPLAIQHGRALEKRVFGDVLMGYEVMDATRLGESDGLPDDGDEEEEEEREKEGGKFDLVVDKSTVDAVSCGGEEQIVKMVEGVRRVLKKRGVWISLNYSERRFALDRVGEVFDVEVLRRIPTVKRREMDPHVFHWCYLLRPKE